MTTLIRCGVGLLLAVVVLWFLLTSAHPLGPPSAVPTAANVGAARNAYQQLRSRKGGGRRSPVVLGRAQLEGIGAVASHGIRPDRLQLTTSGTKLRIVASHRLPMRRWLNITIAANGPSSGFPQTRVRIGALSLPPKLSRAALEAGRWSLRLRGANIPPLDTMVRSFRVQNGTVLGLVELGSKPNLIDDFAETIAGRINTAHVVRIYCALAAAQRQQPSSELAEHVRRAFSIGSQATARAEFNAAAFLALGMVLVDERVSDLARIDIEDLGRCRIAPFQVRIHGRTDLPRHWSLSAALEVAAGAQFSEAVGEWKELADSLAPKSDFAVGAPSGFSMSDLAADRAGSQVARAAVIPKDASRIAAYLRRATPQQLLPYQLIDREDGLSDAEFATRYGSVDDPRFRMRVQQIDQQLAKSGLR